jgi:hypothetical protein
MKKRKSENKTNTQQQTYNAYTSITPSTTPFRRTSDLQKPLKAPLLPSRVKSPSGFGTMRSASGELAKNAGKKKRMGQKWRG